jgi:hypothetical protein
MTLQRTLATLLLALTTATLSAGCNTGSRSSGGASGPSASARVSGALQTARADHAVAAIGSGRILVTGGETLQERATRTAEVFDARSGSGRALGSQMSEARLGHVAAAVSSGDVLILGGRNAAGRGLQTVERFVVDEERFEASDARLRFPRAEAAVSVEAERVVFASGRGQRSVEVFDLATETSRIALELSTPRRGAQLTKISDELYLLYGGQSADPEAPRALWLDLGAGSVSAVGPIEDLGLQGPGATSLPVGAVVFASPREPGVAWLVSGLWKGKENRGVLRLEPDVAPRFLRDQQGLGTPRRGSIGLAHEDGSLSVFAGTWNGLPVSASERVFPEQTSLPSIEDGRETLVAIGLPEGEIALVGGRAADGRPTALVDVILPEGAAGRDAEAAYRDAASERDAERERNATLADERAGLAMTEAEVAQARAELQRTESALAATEAEITRLTSELQASEDATKAAEAEVQRLTQLVTQRQGELAQAQQNANTAADALQAARIQLGNAQRSLGQAQQQAASARQQTQTLQSQVQSAQTQANQLSSKASSLRIQLL